MGVSSETMLKQKETQERSHSGDFFRTLKNKKSKKTVATDGKGCDWMGASTPSSKII